MSSAATPEPQETLGDLLEAIPADLARQAFDHSSWARPRTNSYDRLAYMGDAVLALAISTYLYPLLAEYGVGRLTKVRAQAVSGPACAEVAIAFGFDKRLREQAPDHDDHLVEALLGSERVLSSICEAAIGAVYFGCGYERVAPAVVAAFGKQLDEAINRSADFKSVLQELLARRGDVVEYHVLRQTGPPHDRHFVISARVKGRELGRGEGRSKKLAEQAAAEGALAKMQGGG